MFFCCCPPSSGITSCVKTVWAVMCLSGLVQPWHRISLMQLTNNKKNYEAPALPPLPYRLGFEDCFELLIFCYWYVLLKFCSSIWPLDDTAQISPFFDSILDPDRACLILFAQKIGGHLIFILLILFEMHCISPFVLCFGNVIKFINTRLKARMRIMKTLIMKWFEEKTLLPIRYRDFA